MEPIETKIVLSEEAMETVKRLLIHILNPLGAEDREEIIIHLCTSMDVYPDDPLY